MRYGAVLFDFDYTLGDSTGPIVEGYTRGLAALGWPAPETEGVRLTIGHTLQDGYTMLTGDRDESRRTAFYGHFQEAVGELAVTRGNRMMITDTKLLPGAEALLRGLKAAGIPAGIVSTKLGATIRAILAHNGLEGLTAVIVGAEDVARPKPDPRGLLDALARLGVEPGRALFCGDTVIDARTAQGAGTAFCAVLNGTTGAEAFAALPHVHLAADLPGLQDWLGV